MARSRKPKKTRWVAGALVVLAIAAGVWWWPHQSAFVLPPPDGNRNILIVTIDTLRADALSSYGGPAATPNLDALAAHGARFTFAHAHAVVTLVSHTSLLTGHLPYEHGVRDNSGFRLPAGTATAATRLKAAGFATGAFIGGFTLTKRFGLTPGFDVYDDQMPEVRGGVQFAMPERPADAVVGRAVDWMAAQTTPFFEWVHVFDPHAPYRPPPEYAARYSAQPYYGEVAFVDHALGPLFDRLALLSRPTLVIVTSDHGESLGEHDELTHGMFAYESTLHVPLIISEVDPRHASVSRGRVLDTPVQHLDVLPTVLDVVGAPPDRSLTGTSLREVIRGAAAPDRPSYFEALSFNLTRGWAPLRGVLAGRSKYVDLPVAELYDLSRDRFEQQNLAAAQPERAAALSQTLRSFSVAPAQPPSQEPGAVSSVLRSLGYVSGSAPAKSAYTEADDPKRLAGIDRELHRGQDLYEHGRVDEAIPVLSHVLEQQPKMADAYTYLAYVYWQAGRQILAIQTLERALARGVPSHDVRTRLGLYLAESGTNVARAISLLEALPVADVEGLNGLGVAYGAAGRTADAIRTFRRILELDQTNGLALQNIGSLQLRQALSIANSTHPRRATLLREAETSVRAAIAADPALPVAHTTLGVIFAKTSRRAEAIDSWKKAVDLDPAEFDALYNLVLTLIDTGRRDEARTYGERYLAAAPPAFYQTEIAEIRRLLAGARMAP